MKIIKRNLKKYPDLKTMQKKFLEANSQNVTKEFEVY